jgi:hypothetical protein
MAASRAKGGRGGSGAAPARGAAASAAAASDAAAAASRRAAATKIKAPRPTRVPTLAQRLVVAIYVFFIPLFLILNALCLFSRWTAIPWLL